MIWDFIAILWILYAMPKIKLKDLIIWYGLLCYALVCYDVWTLWPLNTEEFQTFQRTIIRCQILTLICNVNIHLFYFFDETCFTVKIMLHAMACYGILSQMRTMMFYAIIWYFNAMLSYSNAMLSDSNAMPSDSNVMLSDLNALPLDFNAMLSDSNAMLSDSNAIISDFNAML